MTKPYSAACERNWKPILEGLAQALPTERSLTLFEVASGTGQHAVYLAPYLPKWTWILSEVATHHAGIEQWLQEAALPTIQGPLAYEVGKDPFPPIACDIVFTANSFHIMPWTLVQQLVKDCAAHLASRAWFVVYGPFNYEGRYTSCSNEAFDQYLRSLNPYSTIRDFEAIKALMDSAHFRLQYDLPMPTNNRLLVFQKRSQSPTVEP